MQTVFIHELTHSVTRAMGHQDKILFAKQSGATMDEFRLAKEEITSRYSEAIAITIENQVRKDLGYKLRTDVGANEYGTFPMQLTGDPNDTTKIGSKNIEDIAIATTLKSYGSGIVDYFLANYLKNK